MSHPGLGITSGLVGAVFFAIVLAYSVIFFQMIDSVANRTDAQEQARNATIAFISISAIALVPAAAMVVVAIIAAVGAISMSSLAVNF